MTEPEGTGKVVTDPDVRNATDGPPVVGVNHSVPSGPVTMPPFPHVPENPRGAGKNVVVPEVVVRPMTPGNVGGVPQRPSGPDVMLDGM